MILFTIFIRYTFKYKKNLFQGNNPLSNQSYEDMFCKNSNQMGVAVLGDSISAHFHIPEEWLGKNNHKS